MAKFEFTLGDKLKEMEVMFREKASPEEFGKVVADVTNELGMRYLAKAKETSPVLGAQKYTILEKQQPFKNGRKRKPKKVTKYTDSQHLRRSWVIGDPVRVGEETTIEVGNTATYASYVNDGHRQTPNRFVPVLGKRLKKPFVEGKHMTEKAASAVKEAAKPVMRKHVKKFFMERMGQDEK